MTRGMGATEVFIDAPTLLPCGAFVSQRVKIARCQACYGRRHCKCGTESLIPCKSGTHYGNNPKRVTTKGRANPGFVDVNANRRGMGTTR